jgi:hypothetical protein
MHKFPCIPFYSFCFDEALGQGVFDDSAGRHSVGLANVQSPTQALIGHLPIGHVHQGTVLTASPDLVFFVHVPYILMGIQNENRLIAMNPEIRCGQLPNLTL